MKHAITILLVLLCLGLPAFAEPLKPRGDAPEPSWNRLHDYDEITGYLKGYAAAYPDFVNLESIGKSIQGRDMWVATLNNPSTGGVHSKPGMYIDGNTHANEVQGGEATLYALDFLLRNYGKLDRVTEIVDRVAFYFIPMVNPDGRARWFAGPSTPNFPRTVMISVDDDRDGQAEEDGYDDLDGDGVITQMRKKVPMGQGDYRLHPDDDRVLVRVEDGEMGDWVMLGSEGIDNDGDGRINEDTIGYVDPNRTWGYDWQPKYVQGGAGLYPLSIPETRAIAVWALGQPNIAAAQSFHNSGGMILRGPGAKSHPKVPRSDVRAYDLIAEEGERIIPGYEYMLSWKDLYTTFGSTDDHFYRIHGAVTYTNEMYQEDRVTDLDGDEEVTDEERMAFNDHVTLGRRFIDWKEVEHPQYGTVEVGGNRQDVGRVPEGFMLQEEVHRNAVFTLFHAYHLPLIRFGEPTVVKLDKELWRVHLPVTNERAIPTVTAWARQSKVHRLDLVTVEGAKVVASGTVRNAWLDQVDLQEHRPERLMVEGVEGFSTRTLFLLLEGKGDVTVTYDSVKAGKISLDVALK